jgi:hypothetical protein
MKLKLLIAASAIISLGACKHVSKYPIKPGLKYSSVNTNNAGNTSLLSYVDTSGKKEINLKFNYTVNLTKMPSNGIVLKQINLIDVIGHHPDRSQIQDLPAFPSGTKVTDVEEGVLQVTINAKKWWSHVTIPGTLDSVRYRAVLTDYADRTSDTVDIPTIFLQY